MAAPQWLRNWLNGPETPPRGEVADFAVPAPALDKSPPTPPRGEVADSIHSVVAALDGRLEPYNPDLLWRYKGADIYRDMLRDPQIKVAYHLLVSIIINRPWRFELTDDDPRQQEAAAFLSYCVEKSLRGTFAQAMRAVMLAKAQGVSVSEKVFEPGDWNGRSMWLLRAVTPKPYHTFRFQTNPVGNLTGLVQEWRGKRKQLDPRKFIIHVFYPELDPLWGESDLRSAYRAYWSKDVIQKFYNIWAERMAGGLMVAKPTDGGAVLNPTEQGDLKKVLRNVSAASAFILPQGYDLDITQVQSTDAFERALNYWDRQIARGLFLATLLGFSPQERTGGFSQAKEQFKVFMAACLEQGDALADTLNEQLFRDLVRWNFGDIEPPLFMFDRYSDDQKREIAQLWVNAVNNGAVQGTLDDENRFRELIDFDERDPAAEVVTQPGGPPAAAGAEDDDGETEGGRGSTPPGAGRRGRPGGEGDEEAAPRRPSSRDRMAASFAGGSPTWRKRVNFAALAADLDDAEAVAAERLAVAVDLAWSKLTEGLAAIAQDTDKATLDDAAQRVAEAIPPDARRQLQQAAVAALRAGYTLGRESAQDEIMLAADRAPDAMAARLRFAATMAPPRALRLKRDAAPDDPHSLATRWSVAEFAEGVRLDTAERYFAAKGFQIAGGISEELRKQAEAVLLNGIINEKSIREIIAELEPLLRDVIGEHDPAGRRINIGARLNTIVRTNLADAFNQAQLAVWNDPDLGDFVEAYEYSAILDSKTTDFCRRYDGRVLLKSDPEWARITPPNHFNCRSRLIPITAVDEYEPDAALPIQPSPGFGGTAR